MRGLPTKDQLKPANDQTQACKKPATMLVQ